ncbi:hypothetical protein Q3G72_018726 [Acer saccharum]|nr:hypothetical protein Q3G72_018726 [Acer saccharum]
MSRTRQTATRSAVGGCTGRQRSELFPPFASVLGLALGDPVVDPPGQSVSMHCIGNCRPIVSFGCSTAGVAAAGLVAVSSLGIAAETPACPTGCFPALATSKRTAKKVDKAASFAIAELASKDNILNMLLWWCGVDYGLVVGLGIYRRLLGGGWFSLFYVFDVNRVQALATSKRTAKKVDKAASFAIAELASKDNILNMLLWWCGVDYGLVVGLGIYRRFLDGGWFSLFNAFDVNRVQVFLGL